VSLQISSHFPVQRARICVSILEDTKIERLDPVQFGKAPAAPVRLRILTLLRGRALCGNALAARLDVTQRAVSRHLRIPRWAGIELGEKRGYYVHYRLNEKSLAGWRENLDKLLNPRPGTYPKRKGTAKCPAAMTRRKVARRRKT
jgi:DNA-binding transcriptional ArsR family regulator